MEKNTEFEESEEIKNGTEAEDVSAEIGSDTSEKNGESSQEAEKKEGGRKFFRKKDDRKKSSGEVESLNAKIAELNVKVAETNDKYIRLAAEFDNFRRRTAKERLELISSAGEDVLKGLLPTLDDCEKALDMLEKLEGCEAAVEGTKLIYDKLMAYLKSRGVTRIEALGSDFDTDVHEAVAQFPVQEEEKKNKVIDVTRQGYMLKDKVIRFAQVVVGI
ncbi:MAG: nucleotide exchange factor GrpE [Alistipes sp.]|nr:nucleotide exchange factor GrpE [Candidatus Minthomonas equi]